VVCLAGWWNPIFIRKNQLINVVPQIDILTNLIFKRDIETNRDFIGQNDLLEEV